MSGLQAQYYDGRQPVGSPATLIVADQEAVLVGVQLSRRYEVGQLRVSPQMAHADRFIALPDGGQLQCADHPLLDRLPQEIRSEGIIAWLEQRLWVAVACVAMISAMLFGTYFYALPIAAERVAERIPIETERELGRQSLVWLDKRGWFKLSALTPSVQENLRKDAAALYQGLPNEQFYRLEFRDAPFIGPNAFALPGGTIVITDAMVQAAESREEVMAVLAHEIGHVELRHTMRHLLQGSAVATVAASLTADAATLGVAVAGLPALLIEARYSREFETEADDFAFRLLRQCGLSPTAFADLMERLSKKSKGMERRFGFVSTHPPTPERVKRARAAAEQ